MVCLGGCLERGGDVSFKGMFKEKGKEKRKMVLWKLWNLDRVTLSVELFFFISSKKKESVSGRKIFHDFSVFGSEPLGPIV